MSTRYSPASFSWASVAAWPLMKQRERPEPSTVLRRMTWPGSPLRSRSVSHAASAALGSTSNSAASSARSAPSRTAAASPRPPTSSSMASTSIDFPAPVSPVSTVNPSPKSMDDSSISTNPRMSSARSTVLLQVAVLLEYFAPAQLLAQRGEVAVARRVHEAHRVRRALEQQAVALLHVGERKAVEMRARVERAHQHDLDHHAVAHAHRARGKGVRVERHQRERRHRGVQDRALRRHRVGGRAGRRGDDHAVGAQRVDELAVDQQVELDQAPLRALADDGLVERDGLQDRFIVSSYFGFQQRALLDAVLAIENRADAGAHVVVADVGHETDAALVHADQRHVVAHEIARRGEHRAVSADDDRELGVGADRRIVDAAHAEVGRGLALDQHFAAALFEHAAQLPQRLRDLGTAQLADQGDAAEARPDCGGRHALECTMIFMLDKRAQVLLKTLIERYIAEGQPVGSRTLSKHSGLDLSPATIRNVMSDLEDMGFIASPHTSAGRVPTPAGYRFFVDTLLVVKQLESGELRELEGQLHPDNPQRVIHSASQLLSQLSQFAGVVMTPRRAVTFKHVEFLKLSEKRILLIVVTPDGDVQNRILFTERDYSPAELVEVANFINQNYAGQSFEDVRLHLRGELRDLRHDMARLMSAALEAGTALAEGSEQYVISGERNLFAVRDLSQDVGRLKQVLELFERKTSLLKILDLALRGQGVQIFIGGESGVSAPDDVSVVTSPYKVDGEVVGTVGVVGPTRMAYDRVIPIVDVT